MPSTQTEPCLPRLRRDRLSHAYVLIAPGKYLETLGRQLAALMLCSENGETACGVCKNCRKILSGIHPDVITVTRPLDDKGKPKREIYVAQIRDLGADSAVLPNEADKKVYLISDAEYMNLQAQNALLKLLEEPPEYVRFILCVENPGALLDTIRSRCVALYAAADDTCPYFGEQEKAYLRLAAEGDRLGLLRLCLSMEEQTAAELDDFLQNVRLLIGAALAGRETISGLSAARLMEIYTLTDRCSAYIRSNVGVKQILGLIAACTIELE
ncbi:MAG: hypothetical protein AB7D36_00130 [Oscillospiraceae bacterium]